MSNGILLCDDLIFSSRITATARSQNLTVKTVRDPSRIPDLVNEEGATGALLDLAFPGLNLVKLISELKAKCNSMPRIVGYGSHVDVEGLKAAREAGCDLVLPRSAFVEKLETDLKDWLNASE